jgi:fatty-acyl-CoA synthase
MDEVNAMDIGVGSWIERRARIAPDDVALIVGAGQVTYGELARRIRRLAHGLRELGVVRGDRIAWLGPNHPAFLESLFAAGLLGCALAPVNHRMAPDAMADVLADAEPTILIQHHSVGQVRTPASVRQRLAVDAAIDGTQPYEDLVTGSSDDAIDAAVGLEDLLLLPHTSGTVGRPKGVMLSHGNLTWNVVNLLSVADFRHDDVTIAIAPFFRVGGTGVNVLPILFMGGTVVVPEDTSPDGFLASIERHRVTVGFGNPDLLDALLRSARWSSSDLSSIRFVITGGAPVPERLMRAYLERGILLLQGYGLSEASPVVLLLDPASTLRKLGSAGRPPLFVDLRIVDGDGRDVTPGETGELWVRGPNVMAGYWHQPVATRQALTPDGWLRTGDAARRDGEGFVWIVDRIADRFISAGTVVYPGDVERVFLEHPAIADVAVVGIPRAGGDDVAAAFVVLEPGSGAAAPELLAYARTRLPRHAVPASIDLVDRLPRTTVGKLVREELRDLHRSP